MHESELRKIGTFVKEDGRSSRTAHHVLYCTVPFPGGGGALPMMAYTGRLRPKGVPQFRLEVYKTVGISRVEV